jgi:peptidoglycan/xylan/chitin deacetylase (PgdA/CDA1 family)
MHFKAAVTVMGAAMLFISPKKDYDPGSPAVRAIPRPSASPKHQISQRHIYLSFDDGPSAGSLFVNSLALEDSLDVDVFLIGRNACLDAEKRAVVAAYKANPYVEVGNHSYSHAARKYDHYFHDTSVVLADIDRCRDTLHLVNGLVRLPGRNFFRLNGGLIRNDRSNGKAAADVLAAHGYKVYGWDLEWRRKSGNGLSTHTANQMLAIVDKMLDGKKTFVPGSIVVLIHDRDLEDEHFRSEVSAFVAAARADGRYAFEHLNSFGN